MSEENFKQKYKSLKRHLKTLLLEQESLQSDLEVTQRKLLQVSRDKCFLLDRLMKYERISDDSAPDSDATMPSDDEVSKPKKRKTNAVIVQQIKGSNVNNIGNSLTIRKIQDKEVKITRTQENVTKDADAITTNLKNEVNKSNSVEDTNSVATPNSQ